MKKKSVVITGSTRGIGRGIALRLAQEHNVVLNYASDDGAAQEALRLCQQVNSSVLLVKADVSKKNEVEGLMRQCVQHFGALDVLINNAAFVADRPVMEMGEEDWDRVMNTNARGTFLCSQVAAGYMLEQENGGLILNMGASTGLRARKNGANTCPSKAAVMLLTQCLALELGPKIRANTIVPGMTRTDETEKRFHLDDPVVLLSREEAIPLQRIGTPKDISDVVILLMSDEAAFITGQKVFVDGGQYMW